MRYFIFPSGKMSHSKKSFGTSPETHPFDAPRAQVLAVSRLIEKSFEQIHSWGSWYVSLGRTRSTPLRFVEEWPLEQASEKKWREKGGSH